MRIKTLEIPRDPGFEKEKNDCVVRAIQRRIKTSYQRAHEIASIQRKPGHKVLNAFKLLPQIGLYEAIYGKSLKQFLLEYPTKCFIVAKRGHWFVVDNGRVFDDGRMIGLNTRIRYYA